VKNFEVKDGKDRMGEFSGFQLSLERRILVVKCHIPRPHVTPACIKLASRDDLLFW